MTIRASRLPWSTVLQLIEDESERSDAALAALLEIARVLREREIEDAVGTSLELTSLKQKFTDDARREFDDGLEALAELGFLSYTPDHQRLLFPEEQWGPTQGTVLIPTWFHAESRSLAAIDRRVALAIFRGRVDRWGAKEFTRDYRDEVRTTCRVSEREVLATQGILLERGILERRPPHTYWVNVDRPRWEVEPESPRGIPVSARLSDDALSTNAARDRLANYRRKWDAPTRD